MFQNNIDIMLFILISIGYENQWMEIMNTIGPCSDVVWRVFFNADDNHIGLGKQLRNSLKSRNHLCSSPKVNIALQAYRNVPVIIRTEG